MSQGYYLCKGYKEPASVIAWNVFPIAGFWSAAAGIAGYALFIKRYNILWAVAPFAPLWVYLYYNWLRQPQQHIENCYKYLLAKRAATCELEKNKAKFSRNSFVGTKEYGALQTWMKNHNKSVYEVERDLATLIEAGQFRA